MDDVRNTNIKNRDVSIQDLKNMLSTPKIGPKGTTGAWIGGEHQLIGGHRIVTTRSIITLDIDSPKTGFKDRIRQVLKGSDYSADSCFFLHTTASATSESPRSRLIIPLSRTVNSEHYRIISSMIMSDISPEDIDREKSEREFDWSSNETNRIMFRPNITDSDAFFDFTFEDGELLNPDDVIDWYLFCKESYDPYVTLHGAAKKKDSTGIKKEIKTEKTGPTWFNGEDYVGDPQSKDSLIGSFTKVFDIETAIDTFNLPYEYCGGNKWRYEPSSSPPGALIDSSGKFFYCSHATSPACTGHVLNSFDLVRLHKIANGEMTEQNSMREMYKLAMQNEEVKKIEQQRAANYRKRRKY